VFSGVPSTVFSSAHNRYQRYDNVRCATRFGFIVLTKSASVYTVVGSSAAVFAFVLATTNAKEMTGCAMDAAELDIRAHFDDHVVELPL
jgi:hypothetical protein